MEDERPLALRADLDVPTVAAQHDAGGAATIEDQDGPIASFRVQVRQRSGQRRREQRPVAIGELTAKVDDIDHGRPRPTSLLREA